MKWWRLGAKEGWKTTPKRLSHLDSMMVSLAPTLDSHVNSPAAPALSQGFGGDGDAIDAGTT